MSKYRMAALKLLAGLMLCAALGLIGAQLLTARPYMAKSAMRWTLAQPRAAARVGERMDANTPYGAVAVNTAGVDELCALHGIGPALAQRIITERETNGRFYYPEDLLSVRGIGQKTLSGLYAQLSLD